MLSRLADHLFWMSRYIERAENTARMLDVQHQASMLPGGQAMANNAWRAVLELSELEERYKASHDEIASDRVIGFMSADASNPSSILSCLTAARENARAVRVVLAPDLWEAVNSTYLEAKTMLRHPSWVRDPSRFFEWVKLRSHLCRGVMIGTMLKDEAYFFSRIGTFLERADNTARILDVKYLAHGSGDFQEKDRADFYFWASVLRSVSAFEIYRKVYRDVITPLKIAELLIQRADMPRSLLACLNELMINLRAVASEDAPSASLRVAGRLQAEVQYLSIDAKFAPEIHAFLTRFLSETHSLGAKISEEFLVPIAA